MAAMGGHFSWNATLRRVDGLCYNNAQICLLRRK